MIKALCALYILIEYWAAKNFAIDKDEEEKLKDKETHIFNENPFRDGVLKTTGTDVNAIMLSNMANPVSICQGKSFSEYDAILKDLNSDLYGILASVLLKHGKISCIKEFIENVD